MKKFAMIIGFLMALMGFTPMAFAGEYVWGPASTNAKEALKDALLVANEVVKSRDKGCLGGKEETVIQKQEGDKVRYGILISHHNKSCGIDEGLVGNAKRELGIK